MEAMKPFHAIPGNSVETGPFPRSTFHETLGGVVEWKRDWKIPGGNSVEFHGKTLSLFPFHGSPWPLVESGMWKMATRRPGPGEGGKSITIQFALAAIDQAGDGCPDGGEERPGQLRFRPGLSPGCHPLSHS